MATDIAFAVGVLALLGSRVPNQLRVFLLTLAIVDDIGAIVVIAVFYSDSINFGWLGLAAALLVATYLLRRVRVWYLPVYVAIGVGVWFAFLESGVHATIAGVLLGLMTPARPFNDTSVDVTVETDGSWSTVRDVLFVTRETLPVTERLEHTLHPWSAFVILPLFALANAGIELSGEVIQDALSSPLAWGVVLGLVVGKPLGVVAASFLTTRTGLGALPDGVGWAHVVGAGALAGIGFTMSLFVSGLAFSDALLVDEAKIGILAASVVAASIGAALLARTRPNHRTTERPSVSAEPTA